MFIPESYALALVLMIINMTCWGSWANTYKLTKGIRFELFYWDYAAGIFLMSLVLAFTLGSTGGDDAFLANLGRAGGRQISFALLAGTIFNLANLLLLGAIAIAGLAVAFPVGIGTALVTGTVLTYLVEPKGNGVLITGGVALAILAVLSDAKAYREVAASQPSVTKKSIVMCIASGLLMGSWSPLTTAAMAAGPGQLTPYTSTVFFTLAALLSTLPFNLYLMKKPIVGEPVSMSGYFKNGSSWHLLGILGGCIWAVGTGLNLVAGRKVGFAIAYAVGQSAPMIAALWGVFVWKEFSGATPQAKRYLALMFIFYVGAIAVLTSASMPS